MQDKEIETLAYAAARAICEYFNLSEDLIPLTEEEVDMNMKSGLIYYIEYRRVRLQMKQCRGNGKALKSHGFDTIIKEERQ